MKKRILAIGAHPDDLEIGCGGTIRLFADNGAEIRFVVATSGEQGSLGAQDQLRQDRENEARESASILGVEHVVFLHEPDGLTNFCFDSKIRLIKIIRNFRPDLVFIHSSSDHFPDHKIIRELSMSALQAAAGPWFPEGGTVSHMVRDVFGFEVWNTIECPQLLINIDRAIGRKLDALECHRTQTMKVNYIGAVCGLNEYRGAISMSGKYAEGFEVIKLGVDL